MESNGVGTGAERRRALAVMCVLWSGGLHVDMFSVIDGLLDSAEVHAPVVGDVVAVLTNGGW